MKKLMIAAAAAAMISGAYADAQVYDVKFSVKTTAAAKGKLTTKSLMTGLAGFDKTDLKDKDLITIAYRKQATRTIQGLIWGCDCDTANDVAWYMERAGKANDAGTDWKQKPTFAGYIFWDASSKEPFSISGTKFEWILLNRMNIDFQKLEGAFNLGVKDPGKALYFTAAGFGTAAGAKVVYDKDLEHYDLVDACKTYIKSISGNFAGVMTPVAVGWADDIACTFCDDGADETVALGATLPYCIIACDDVKLTYDPSKTAAYGTWSIKYNSSASKKLMKASTIMEAYSFSKLPKVNTALEVAYGALWKKAAYGDIDWKNCEKDEETGKLECEDLNPVEDMDAAECRDEIAAVEAKILGDEFEPFDEDDSLVPEFIQDMPVHDEME